MRRYRMNADASVCFDIMAESDEEAIAKAKATMVLSAEFDDETEGLEDVRTYLKLTVAPEVDDWFEEEVERG